MLRLFAIIAFIYVLYLFIRYAIRRSLIMSHPGFQQQRNFRNTHQNQRSNSRRSRFDNVEDAEYEEIDDQNQTSGSSTSKA